MTELGVDLSPQMVWALAIVGVVAFLLLPITILVHKTASEKAEDNWIAKLGLQNLPAGLTILAVSFGAILFLVLFLGLIWSILGVAGLGYVETPEEQTSLRGLLITITALTATLGAVIALPLTLVRVQFTARQTVATEEGLITDRINAAVLGLGAEKEVNRLGRNVVLKRDEEAVTVFHWQDEPLEHEDGWSPDLSDKGTTPYQNVALTKPNLEVRIGAILALERLARNNLDVHVQIMEILCAYIRENAPASGAKPGPNLIYSLGDISRILNDEWGAAPTSQDELRRQMRYRNHVSLREWKTSLAPIRADIEVALNVVSRRTTDQRRTEATHGQGSGHYVFVVPPPLCGNCADATRYQETLKKWRNEFAAYKGYRPDLRKTNLQGADLTEFDLRGCLLSMAQMQAVELEGASLQGADLTEAELQGASPYCANLQGSNLRGAGLQNASFGAAQLQGVLIGVASLQGSDLDEAELQGAELTGTDLRWAELRLASLQGATLIGTQMQGTNLAWADLQGAYCSGVQIDELTELTDSTWQGAAIRSIEDDFVERLWATRFNFYADGTVAPDDPNRPGHWPMDQLDPDDFERQWRAWQATLPPGWAD